MPSHRGVIKRSPGDLVMFCLWVVAVPWHDFFFGVIPRVREVRTFVFGGKCFFFPQRKPVGFSELYSTCFLVPGLAMGSAFTHGVPKVPIR